MNGPKTYTAIDIERYHSGQLTAAERHGLEKAALDDPFLADALEGYAAAETPTADLNVLKQKLQLRIEKGQKRRSPFFIGNNWMKVAALFILIALGGWLFLQIAGNKEDMGNESVALKQSNGANKTATPDSVTVSSDAPGKTFAAPAATEKVSQPIDLAKNKSTPRKKPVDNQEIPTPTAPRSDEDKARTLDGYTASNAAPPAEPKTEALKKSVADAKDKEQLGAASTTDTIKNFDVTLKRSNESLQEVVVGSAAKRGEQRKNASIDSPEPIGGWKSFDDYVANNLKEPREVKEKILKGEVELSFEVNKDGEPVHISVTQSLCARCDEEAVRLLKEGPRWKPGRNKGKIKIKFPPPQ